MGAAIDPAGMLASFATAKLLSCQRQNGDTDMIPILQVEAVTGEGAMWQIYTHGHPVDAIPAALANIRAEHGDLQWAAFLADAHVKTESKDAPRPRRGDFAREFDSDPASTVCEALTITWRDRDGGCGLSVVTYSFPDGPLPIFGSQQHHRLAGGDTGDALTLAFL